MSRLLLESQDCCVCCACLNLFLTQAVFHVLLDAANFYTAAKGNTVGLPDTSTQWVAASWATLSP